MSTVPIHPGQYVRQTYLEPRGLTVTDAAKLIGISRPGVSNFLNGKVSVTENIAARIERAFGIPKADLITKQAEYDAAIAYHASAPANTKTYVPPFLGIQANEIENWADHNIPARIRFSVFLRTLVHSTGVRLESVEFHGNDDAERPGWDGFVIASSGTPWIPEGKSGWEFGVNVDVKSKADGDFEKSVKAYSRKPSERAEITFVFVTPRSWTGKEAWVNAMRAKNLWKNVRAYDSSDIEQWLEQSPAGQTWFANETNKPSQGVRSLDQCWADWANVASPPISGMLFDTAKEIAQPKLKSFLDKPAGEPFVIAADSVEEALAFLAQAFNDPEFQANRDKILVFDHTGTLPKLAQGMQDFIAVVYTREVEREVAPHVHKVRTIIVYPRNATNEDPKIVLEPVGYEPFRKGLEAMDFSRHEVTRLANESGHSLTVLRRRLSKVDAVRTPQWASDSDTAISLIPIVLIGVWNAESNADQVAVSLLAGDKVNYDEIERRLQALIRLNDAPVWSVGKIRGVVSKLDALFAVAHAVTINDIQRFLEIAKLVLGEDDPSLDMPEKDRWLADMHGKRREFSGALRNGVAETLVLLAVHGKHLFKRLGFDGEIAAATFIRELLVPLTTRKLEANERDLSVYAEAAPDAFLKILEDDLRSETPQVLGLLRPTDTSMFGVSSPRTGLLWALEGLAWNPEIFMRTVLILGRLSQVELKDNLANKPIASLGSIFRSWMPQTAADHDARVRAVATLLDRYPDVGWTLCVSQFGRHGNDVGDYSHKPRWRGDGYGFGEPSRYGNQSYNFQVAMVEMALSRPTYTVTMIGDLVERLHGLGKEYQRKVWKIIDEWRKAGANDDDIAILREKVRVTVLSRRARRRTSDSEFAALTENARKIYDSLEPSDLINKHEWLFRQSWVEESADEFDDGDRDFRKRDERIKRLRSEALKAIYDACGLAGIFALACKGSAQGQIGWHLVRDVLAKENIAGFIEGALLPGSNDLSPERKNLVFGALQALPEEECLNLLLSARERLPESDFIRLLLLAPYRKSTWTAADAMSSEGQESYWRDVYPTWIYEPEEHNSESIARLIKVKRPRAAFSAVHFQLEGLRRSQLVELLVAIAQVGNDRDDEHTLHDHDIKEAFKLLDHNPDVTLEQKAGLEFAYINVLAEIFGRGSHIGNLERYVENHPEMWVQALAWAYRRKNRGEDPESFRLPDGRKDLAERGHRLLEGMQRIPGQETDGTVTKEKLAAWVDAVRKVSTELDRIEMCDVCLGKLLSHAPADADGVWPCEAVRDVMEDLQSQTLLDGAHTGLYNQRGAVWRGEGGGQERDLAQKYRRWGEALRFTHPYLSSSLLMEMARTYEREAQRQDEQAGIRRRLQQ